MSVVTLVRSHLTVDPLRVVAIGTLSGIASAAVLAFVNSAAASVEQGKPTTSLFFLFLAAVFVYVVSQRFVLIVSVREVEKIVHAIRMRIFEQLTYTDLPAVERIGRSTIFSAVTKETQTISQTVNVLVMGAQSAILLAFSTLYLALLSVPALVVGVVFTALAFIVMFRKNRQILAGLRGSMAQEAEVFDVLGGMLSGFKETRMNSARAAALLEDFRARSEAATASRIAIRSLMAESMTLSQALVFFLIGAMVFAVPVMYPSAAPSVIKTATAVLFMVGPLQGVVNAVPLYNMANAASANIEEVEAALRSAARQPVAGVKPFAGVSRIAMEGVRFRHTDVKHGEAFEIGPIDLQFSTDQTVFITGGNGSGKTTLIQVLVGLHQPMAGRIVVDGRVVDEDSRQAYRNLFAVVFSDCHLFRRLYGLGDPKPEIVERWLGELEIAEKTAVADGAFTTLDLSAGQRKRLALLVALLEDRPIVVLDEWAADQDPEFRRKFYRQLLADLKAMGKTVIAITHDDRYFDAADRHIRMEYGKIASDSGSADHA